MNGVFINENLSSYIESLDYAKKRCKDALNFAEASKYSKFERDKLRKNCFRASIRFEEAKKIMGEILSKELNVKIKKWTLDYLASEVRYEY